MSRSKYEQYQVVSRPPWTHERVQILRTMWMKGKSIREIAFELGGGTTRSAVIGKAHRIGLPPHPGGHDSSASKSRPGRSAPQQPRSEFTRPPSDNKPAKNLNELAAKEAVCAEWREELKSERIEQVPASVGAKPCTIDELNAEPSHANCHWPLGGKIEDRFGYFYCGAPAELEQGNNPPRPYCPYHRIMRNFGRQEAERARRHQETVHHEQTDLAIAS